MDSLTHQVCQMAANRLDVGKGRLPVADLLDLCKRHGLGKEHTAHVRLWLECALDCRVFNGVYESPVKTRRGSRRVNAFGWPTIKGQHRAMADLKRSADIALAKTPADSRGATERARRAVVRQGAKSCAWYIDDRKGLLVGPNGTTKAPGMTEIDKQFVVIGWDSDNLRTLLRPRRSA